jgi:hypothetical protein
MDAVANPFRPGAGHMPPYLAGRTREQDEIRQILKQTTILENVVLTGLRGVGKTVLLETIRPIARSMRWLWIGQDMSEAASISESMLAQRIIADLAVMTSTLLLRHTKQLAFGFNSTETIVSQPVGYEELIQVFEKTPGLISDKLKAVMEFVWHSIPPGAVAGIVFAYDEAQNLADHSKKEQFPLSLMLDVFGSFQRRGIPYLLILTGLPTLFPKLVEARTYSERMFHTIFLRQLDAEASREAIAKPVEDSACPIQFSEETVHNIVGMSGGYPYFIQFICREIFDAWLGQLDKGTEPSVPVVEITRKLDNDFFVGRWAKATDRQRELMQVIALLPNCEQEFTVQEVVNSSKDILAKSFSNSHANQMLSSLSDAGFVYKNRYGKYSFAVPLFASFVKRQLTESINWSHP